MFVPTGTKDGPPVKVLSGERSTKVDYCNGSKSEIVNDDWLSKHNRCLDSLWTGCTVFPLGYSDTGLGGEHSDIQMSEPTAGLSRPQSKIPGMEQVEIMMKALFSGGAPPEKAPHQVPKHTKEVKAKPSE